MSPEVGGEGRLKAGCGQGSLALIFQLLPLGFLGSDGNLSEGEGPVWLR